MSVKCPYCKTLPVRVTTTEGLVAMPQKGDYSVCDECGEVMVFLNDKGDTRKITEREETEMDNETRELLSRTQHRIKTKIRQRETKGDMK